MSLLLETEWMSYRNTALENERDEKVILEAKTAFLAGATSVLNLARANMLSSRSQLLSEIKDFGTRLMREMEL